MKQESTNVAERKREKERKRENEKRTNKNVVTNDPKRWKKLPHVDSGYELQNFDNEASYPFCSLIKY